MGEPTPIQQHMLNMFIWLRLGVGAVGLALPIILGCVGYFGYEIPLAGSMSAYYHQTKACAVEQAQQAEAAANGQKIDTPDCKPGTGPLRNWFVGSLFFIGGAMLLMRGFSRLEDWLLDGAGILAPCVALFPMGWGDQKGHYHLAIAIGFFVCIGLTAIVCSTKTLSQLPADLPNRAKRIAFYRRWYRFFGIMMIAAPTSAFIFLAHQPVKMFMVEAAGVWAFGLFWIFKTFELKRSDVEKKIMCGEIGTERNPAFEWKETKRQTAAPAQT